MSGTGTLRPGWIYFALFAWNASQGRFTALFLQDRMLTEEQIGVILALKYVLSMFVGPLVSSWSDSLVLHGYKHAHALVVACCVVLTTFFFLCQSLPELEMFELLDANHLSNRYYYFIFIRSLYSISMSPIMSILDGVTLEYLVMTKKEKSLYGNERMFGAISWAIVSFMLGISIDQYDTKVMYFYNICLLVPVLATLYWFEILKRSARNDEQIAEKSMTEAGNTSPCSDLEGGVEVREKLTLTAIIQEYASVSTVIFLMLCTTLSIGTSIVENLLFLMFTNTLGSSNFICGVSVVVTVVFEIPLFFYGDGMLNFFGPVKLLAISTLSYSVRVFGYTLVPKSANWMVLFMEPLHGVTFSCMKMASVEYVSQNTPVGYDVSIQGLLAGLQNMGSFVGVSLGGYIEEEYGSQTLYRGAAGMVTFFLIVFITTFVFPSRKGDGKIHCDNLATLTNDMDIEISSKVMQVTKQKQFYSKLETAEDQIIETDIIDDTYLLN